MSLGNNLCKVFLMLIIYEKSWKNNGELNSNE